MVAYQVKRVLLATNQFRQADVVSHLVLDFSQYESTVKEYSAPDGRTEGQLAERQEFNSSSSGGVGDIPGTDSNDDNNNNTSYLYPNYNNQQSDSSETSEKYLPNERTEYSVTPAGGVIYEESSMSIALISYREYYEDSVRRQGLLDGGITWEDFKETNGADIRLTVDDDYYDMAANATGISRDRITIIAYETPVFHDKEGWSQSDTSTLLSVLMILLILGLLAFVVLRGMRTKKAEGEEEEELSVEGMLQSTSEASLELDVETKSETRLLIEKFVDENPEAAASLLRNWLNEDWT